VQARVEAFGPPLRNQHLGAGTRDSAVLAVLYEADEQPRVVLTRRAQHLRAHRGEVSFPGGGADPGESLVDAALREAQEEIGLDPAEVQVVGELDHLSTFSSRAAIAPFVAVLPGRPALEPNTGEVEHILQVPLAELLLPEVFREERWRLPSADRPIYFFELVGDTIWGATARMLRQLLAIATGVESRDTEDAW
jgi:8-oxo-dGTP pyrophosphatase MutT (NUDIX family)